MKKTLAILVWVAVLLFGISSSPQAGEQRGVVIPLGSNGSINSASPGSQAVSVAYYDANDLLIGYLLKPDGREHTMKLVSTKKYSAHFDNSWRMVPGTVDPASGRMQSFGFLPVYYDNPKCTGAYYVPAESRKIDSTSQPGTVYGGTAPAQAAQVAPHYIPRNSQKITLKKAYKISRGCIAVSKAISVYQLVPNDPAVTGFENKVMYDGPFKMAFASSSEL